MYQEQALQINPEEITRCEEQIKITDHGKSLTQSRKRMRQSKNQFTTLYGKMKF